MSVKIESNLKEKERPKGKAMGEPEWKFVK